jgi:hypothetical protein
MSEVNHTIRFGAHRIEIYSDGVSGSIQTNLQTDHNEEGDEFYNAAMDGIESLLLALACEGIDVSTDKFKNAIEDAVEACANNI